jgi:hypothetical protein
MPIPTHEERIEFWKHSYARASFVDARIFIEHILETRLPLNHPARKALSIAVLTTYCRPFKQRAIVRLSEDIVPTEHREAHNSAIEMRDKVVAHRDIDGPVADWGFVSQLEIAIGGYELVISTSSPVMPDDKAREMLPLVDWLIDAMDTTVNAFAQAHLRSLATQTGLHVLRMDNHPTEWTTQVR